MVNNQQIGLRALRVDKGYTQSKVAEILEVSPRTIYMWESGRTQMRPMHVFALAYLYGVDHKTIRTPVVEK